MSLAFPLASNIVVTNQTKGIFAASPAPEYVTCGSIDCESVCSINQPAFKVLGMNPGDHITVGGITYHPTKVGIPYLPPLVGDCRVDLYTGSCKQGSGGGYVATTHSSPVGLFGATGADFRFDLTVGNDLVNIAKTASFPTFYVKISKDNQIGYSREIPIVITTNQIVPCIPIPTPNCSQIKPNTCVNPPCDQAGTTPTSGVSLFNCGPLQPVCNAVVIVGILAAIGIGVYIASPAIRAGVGIARGAVKKRVSRKKRNSS